MTTTVRWRSRLLAPYPAQVMQAQQSGPQINSSRNDYPELFTPLRLDW
jgi:hypothetical protein